jgi:hypothetical protein
VQEVQIRGSKETNERVEEGRQKEVRKERQGDVKTGKGCKKDRQGAVKRHFEEICFTNLKPFSKSESEVGAYTYVQKKRFFAQSPT